MIVYYVIYHIWLCIHVVLGRPKPDVILETFMIKTYSSYHLSRHFTARFPDVSALVHLQEKPGMLINDDDGLLIDYELVILGESSSSLYPKDIKRSLTLTI